MSATSDHRTAHAENDPTPAHSTSRRSLFRAGTVAAAAAGLTAATGAVASPAAAKPASGPQKAGLKERDGVLRRPLRFRDDGTFTIVQFNDTQDSHRIDRRTIELQEAVLDDVEPDFALINGDCIAGGMKTPEEAKQALNNVVLPMESRGIPWALTWGNHDEDSTKDTGVDEQDYVDFLRSYRHSLQLTGPSGVTGTTNQVITVESARRKKKDAFAIWLLDSGRYAPEEIAGQDFEGYPDWDWLRFDQVEWYARISRALEEDNGALVHGLAFQHIPLWEHRFMWFGGVDTREDGDASRGKSRHSIVGERNEAECPGPFNSGMFSAMLHRGDVRGLFVGHDHINDYVGNYYGIELGYGPGTGFGPYGLDGDRRNHMRGARVFRLDESADGVYASTELKFAKDYGIDMDPARQEVGPSELPDYVR